MHQPFKIKQAKDGQFYWVQKSNNQRTLCKSEEMQKVQNTVKSIRASLQASANLLYELGLIPEQLEIDKDVIKPGINFSLVDEPDEEEIEIET